MCDFCDEKGLPCLLCGQAIMRHQFDRGRCGGCAQANRPPREWPVFRFCPYCGRNLGMKTSEDTEEEKQEETEMGRFVWTAEHDEVIRGMILEGKTVADICDRIGCTDTQLKNHVSRIRQWDKSFPTLFGKSKRFVLASSEAVAVLSGEPGQIMVEPVDEGSVELIEEPAETEEKKADLNPLEKEMADIIAENNETIELLRHELSAEKEARAEEGKAYREEIDRLREACREKDEELDKLRDTSDNLRGIIRRKKEDAEAMALERDDVDRLKYMVRERNEVIYQMTKAIFLGSKEGSRE